MAVALAVVLALSPLQELNAQYDHTHPDGWDQIQEEASSPQFSSARSSPPGVEQWRPLVAGHFNPEDVERVLCLMGYESGGNPDARNQSSGAAGLMQIMPFWAPEYGLTYDDLFTPEINLYVARQIRDSQGWNAWSPYKRGECR